MLSLSVLHPNNAVWIMWLNCWLVYDLSDSLNSHVFYPLFAAMSHIPRSYQLMWKCNLSIIINRNDSQDYTNKTQVKINQNDRYVYIYIYIQFLFILIDRSVDKSIHLPKVQDYVVFFIYVMQ